MSGAQGPGGVRLVAIALVLCVAASARADDDLAEAIRRAGALEYDQALAVVTRILDRGTTTDPADTTITEPAVLLTPYWVNAANMQATVITDKAIDATQLFADVGADVCTSAGITAP